MNNTVPERPRNFGLDAIRAVAILLVIFAHLFESTWLFQGGLLGVEIFFVLSGYLIGGILFKLFRKEPPSRSILVGFWLRRWFRTVPNYLLFLGIAVVVGCLFKGNSLWDWRLYPLFLQNFAWPMQPLFGVSWSLAVEEWFYLLFAGTLLIVVSLRKSSKIETSEIIVAGVFLLIPFLIRLIICSWIRVEIMRSIVVCRLDSMMFGVMVAWIHLNRSAIWNRFVHWKWTGPAVILIGAGVVMFLSGNSWAGAISFSFISFGVALVIPFVQSIETFPKVCAGVVTYISKVSYSAYLLHSFIFIWSERLVASYKLNGMLKLGERLTLIVVILLLSYIPYRLVERPFMLLRNRLPKSSSQERIQPA